MKNSKKRTAILVLVGSTLMLQSIGVEATSGINAEGSNLEVLQTSTVEGDSTLATGEVNSESMQTSTTNEEGNYLETSANEASATTSSAVMLDKRTGNEYTIALQQKINDTLAKVEERQGSGTVFAQNELNKELYLLTNDSHDSLDYLNEVIGVARQLITGNSTNQQAIQEASNQIDTAYNNLRTIETYDSFSGIDGAVWKDTNGVKIQAHGGHVQKLNGKWWWYGEDKTKGYRSNGISAYSSDDLYNWKFEGFVMRTIQDRTQLDNDPYFTALYGNLTSAQKDKVYQAFNAGYWLNGQEAGAVIERPKMIYNEKTGKYIIWFHADGPTQQWPNTNYAAASAGVAISDSPNGPFKFIDRYRLNTDPESYTPNNPGMARDMNLFIDDDKTAYIVYSSEENGTMYISKLNEDYTGLTKTDMTKVIKGVDYTYLGNPEANTGVKGEDYNRIFPGWHREAPALFKYNGKYYIITSDTSGWAPNQAKYAVADNILGEWTEIGDPCIDDTDHKTFYSQSTSVINYDKDSGKLIYMGDRWNEWNLQDSRYVWLPLEFDSEGNLSIKPYGNWKLEDLENKYSVHVNTVLKDLYASVQELPKTLNVKLYENNAWIDKDVAVTWETANLAPMTQTTVKGVLDVNGREINVQANLMNIPSTLEYYIDCGAKNGSTMYDLVNGTVQLKNNQGSDKAYTQGSWGYVGNIGTDIQYINDNSTDTFESGFWAYKDKSINYKVPLAAGNYNLFAGFKEWWWENRNTGISISYTDANGQVVKQELGSFWNNGVKTVNYGFNLPINAEVTISIHKMDASNPDVILSWLAIESNNVKVLKEENSNMKDLYTNVNELPSSLNIKVFENGAWVNKNTTVTWNTPKLVPMTKTTITGVLDLVGKEITADIIYIPSNLQYYVDCGAKNGSTMYDLVNGTVQLKNNQAYDQAYTQGSWGYTGAIGTDIQYKNEYSTDTFDSGFWAYSNKTIDYKVSLEAGTYKLFTGFNDWWGRNRSMGVSVSYTNANGQVVKQEIGNFVNTYRSVVNYDFILPENAEVTISIHKFNNENSDVILNWFAVEKINSNTTMVSSAPATDSENMATGWVNENGTWYYVDESGSKVSNTTVDGYQLGEDGSLV